MKHNCTSKLTTLYLFLFLFLHAQNTYADSITAAALINNNDAVMGAPAYSCFNPVTNKFFVGWISGSIYYSVYNGNGTLASGPTLLVDQNDTVAPFTLPVSSYNSRNNQFLISYMGSSAATQRTWYNILDQNGASIAGPLATNNVADNESGSLVWSCYNSTDNVYVLAWGSTNNLGFFAIIGASGTIIKNSTAIANCEVDANGGFNVAVSYNSRENTYLFTWQQSNAIYYAIYSAHDGNPALVTQSSITPPADASAPIIASSYNSALNIWLITWNDTSNQGYFATINSTGTVVTTATRFSTNVGRTNFAGILSSYNPQNDEYFLSWQSADRTPMYANCSIKNSITIDTETITGTFTTGLYGSVFHAYNTNTNSFLISWIKETPQNGYSSLFTRSLPAPTLGKGQQLVNRFANYGEYFNQLTWNPSGITNLASYNIYRSGTLIATIAATKAIYEDHNQPKTSVEYTVKAVNSYGAQSNPVAIQI